MRIVASKISLTTMRGESMPATVIPFPHGHHARARVPSAAAKAASVICLQPFLRAKSKITGQRRGGIPRLRQQLTVDASARDLSFVSSRARSSVPPKSSMILSQVMTGPTICCDLQPCQDVAACKLTVNHECAKIASMAVAHAESTAAIARRLKATREALGYPTQNEFAKALGVDRSSYNLFENGKRRLTNDVALKMRRKFGISLDWIFCGEVSQLPVGLIAKLGSVAA